VSFNVLTIRSGLDAGDDVLHPMLSDAAIPEIIAMDGFDGRNVMKVVATGVRVLEIRAGDLKTLAQFREVKIDVYITDGRLALACEKYDKGGGWVGFGGAGLLVAVTANAVSKARAASRRRGRILVGHIRYPWLKSVGASSKSGWASSEAIRLGYSEKGSGATVHKLLELTLPKNIDAALVAQEIVHRAAAYRLAYYPSMTAEQRAASTSLIQAPRLAPPPKKFAFHHMPAYFHVTAGTAFPRQAQPGVARPDAVAPAPDAPAADAPSSAVMVGAVAPAAVPSPALRPGGAHRAARSDCPGGQVPGPIGGLNGSPPSGSATKFCTQCGTRTVAGDNFCAKCGAALH